VDQQTFQALFGTFQQQCSAENNLPDLAVSSGRPEAPIVVLIHGIGGNARHWADPIGLNPADTWLFDLSAQPHGASGLGSSPPYQPGSVTAWCDLLRTQEISWVTWSQSQPGDLIQYAVAEAVAVLTSIEQKVFPVLEQDVAANGGTVPPLVLLCHSRGGLVARAALKQLGSAGVPHLHKVITLCTPHHGSYMPALADTYNNTLSNQMDFSSLGHNLPGPLGGLFAHKIDPILADLANRVRAALLHSFGTLAQGPGFDELDPQSVTLQALADGEQPLPGVRYYGFGGTNPTFVHFYLSEMGHTVHLLGTASAFLVEQLARMPGVGERFGGLTELDKGDSAVGPTSSTWPDAFGAPHQTFAVNHMQALIDPALQQATLVAIRE